MPPSASQTDNGVITFTDVDLTDAHLVSATGAPVGTTLGSLTAVLDHDTTGTVVDCHLTHTYIHSFPTRRSSDLGQTKVESFTITLDDQNGGLITKQIDVTITGTNDAPVLNAAQTPVLTAENEDAGTPVGAVGTLVSSLVALTGGVNNVTDVDSGAVTG